MAPSGAIPVDEGGRGRADRIGVATAVIGHALLLAALSVSLTWRERPRPQPPTTAMQVSVVPGEGSTTPRSSAPVAAPRLPVPEAVEPVETQAERVDQDAVDAPTTTAAPGVGSDTGGTIWTPPAPDPEASRLVADAKGDVRVVLPVVKASEGASEPQLLSYDQGRYSDAVTMAEAGRVAGSGTIVMTVLVGPAGDVQDCRTSTTSGSAELDARGCSLVSSYRYRPARDAAGNPHPAYVTEVLEWSRDGGASRPASPAAAVPAVAAPAASGAVPHRP